MKDGEILQVGPPLEIYNYPVNKFVGGFIGSPAMNFVTVQLVEKESMLFAISDGLHLPIPVEKKDYLQNFVNEEVILGVRPEHLEEKSFADRSVFTESFTAVVDVVEILGAEIQLDVSVGSWPAAARAHGLFHSDNPTVGAT